MIGMIGIKEEPDEIIKIEFRFRKDEIFDILRRKGYKIESRVINVPLQEEFLIIEPAFTYITFTALKENKEWGMNDFYLTVLGDEIKKFFSIKE